jgi:uncharacterized protein YndB with AHSA1/START domain
MNLTKIGDENMATISHRITVKSPQDQVFQALSTLEGLRSWYTSNIEGAVGKNQEAVFSFTDEKPIHWKVIELKPNSLVRWECTEGPGAAVNTTVTYRLTNKGNNQTVVECDHENWAEGDPAFKSCNTRWGILVGYLKKYAETGYAEPAYRGELPRQREGSQRKQVARG